MAPPYCTVEDVERALDVKPNHDALSVILDAIHTGSREVDALGRNRYYPEYGSKAFDWPQQQPGLARWKLDFLGSTLVDLVSLTSGGTLIAPTDLILKPSRSGPPYTHLEINTGSGATFTIDGSTQQSAVIVGTWGWDDVTTPATTLDGAIGTTDTTLQVDNGAAVDIGSTLIIGGERIQTTARAMIDSGAALNAALGNGRADVTVPVADPTVFNIGELLQIDSEQMRVEGVTATTLTVERSVNGVGALAAHTDTTAIFASRSFTVERGVTGTTAANHTDGTAISKQVYQPEAVTLAKAEAINIFSQDRAAWGRTVGSGDGQREASGSGLTKQRAMFKASPLSAHIKFRSVGRG